MACLALTGAFRLRCLAAEDPKGGKSSFRLKWVLIADSEAKVAGLTPPAGGEKLFVADVPFLLTQEFHKIIDPRIGEVVTADLVNRLVNDITEYVRRHGQQLVYVTVPEQNISQGALRIVVVLGRYNLSRLLVSDSPEKAAALKAGPGAGQVVIDDVPGLAASSPIRNSPRSSPPCSAVRSPTRRSPPLSPPSRPAPQATGPFSPPCRSRPIHHRWRIAAGGVVGNYPLHRIVIVDTPSAAAAVRLPEGAGAVVAEHSPLFATSEFARFAAPYIGRPITPALIEGLKKTWSPMPAPRPPARRRAGARRTSPPSLGPRARRTADRGDHRTLQPACLQG